MQTYKLAKMLNIPFETNEIIEYDESANGNVKTTTYEHNFMFSRMFGLSDEDVLKGGIRYIFAEADKFYTTKLGDTPETERKYVMRMNEDGTEYEKFIEYADFLKDEGLMEELRKSTKKRQTLERLANKEALDLTADEFSNPEMVDIKLKNGDKEYLCRKTIFKQPIGEFLIFVKADNKYGFEIRHLGFENCLYRTTKHPSMTTYVAIPEGSLVGFQQMLEDDEEKGKTFIYKSDLSCLEEEPSALYMSEEELYKDEDMVKYIRENAVDEKEFFDSLISLQDENTEVYMVVA
jgi:hypothetical protein